jgi:WD40 repeat protein
MDAVVFSPDGKFIISGERDNTVKIWDVAKRWKLATLTGHNWQVSSLSFSPDGKWLASGSFDGTVLLWEVNLDAPGWPVEPAEKQLATWGEVKKTELHQNFPNPFNPETWIPFSLSKPEHVIIKIYSLNGQLVRTLDLGRKPSGAYLSRDKAAYWNGANEAGEMVASDVYFYAMETDGKSNGSRKMVMMR